MLELVILFHHGLVLQCLHEVELLLIGVVHMRQVINIDINLLLLWCLLCLGSVHITLNNWLKLNIRNPILELSRDIIIVAYLLGHMLSQCLLLLQLLLLDQSLKVFQQLCFLTIEQHRLFLRIQAVGVQLHEQHGQVFILNLGNHLLQQVSMV